jgi:hypothetical protein
MTTHFADILSVDGLPNAQAVVVDDSLLASRPGEGEGDLIGAPTEFFATLGAVTSTEFVVQEQEISPADLGLSDSWTWPEAVQAVVRQRRRDMRKHLLVEARRLRAEYGDAWKDGYCPADAEEVLRALNSLVRAARLDGKIVLVWQFIDEWGPGGNSALFYISSDGLVVDAGDFYPLVNGERKHTPCVDLLERIRYRKATVEYLAGFPRVALPTTRYQAIDPRCV